MAKRGLRSNSSNNPASKAHSAIRINSGGCAPLPNLVREGRDQHRRTATITVRGNAAVKNWERWRLVGLEHRSIIREDAAIYLTASNRRASPRPSVSDLGWAAERVAGRACGAWAVELACHRVVRLKKRYTVTRVTPGHVFIAVLPLPARCIWRPVWVTIIVWRCKRGCPLDCNEVPPTTAAERPANRKRNNSADLFSRCPRTRSSSVRNFRG